jgi:hypothetical protein
VIAAAARSLAPDPAVPQRDALLDAGWWPELRLLGSEARELLR